MGFDLGRWVGHVAKGIAKDISGDVLHAARAQLPPALQQGFDQASAILQDPSTALGGAAGLLDIRRGLRGINLKGFDMAASLYGGLSRVGPHPDLPPAQQAGFLMTHGMADQAPAAKVDMMTTIAAAPDAKAGAAVAVKQVADSRKATAKEGWWIRFLRAVHLHK